LVFYFSLMLFSFAQKSLRRRPLLPLPLSLSQLNLLPPLPPPRPQPQPSSPSLQSPLLQPARAAKVHPRRPPSPDKSHHLLQRDMPMLQKERQPYPQVSLFPALGPQQLRTPSCTTPHISTIPATTLPRRTTWTMTRMRMTRTTRMDRTAVVTRARRRPKRYARVFCFVSLFSCFLILRIFVPTGVGRERV